MIFKTLVKEQESFRTEEVEVDLDFVSIAFVYPCYWEGFLGLKIGFKGKFPGGETSIWVPAGIEFDLGVDNRIKQDIPANCFL